MVNYGDVTKINGYDVPPVEVVIGGSPCQDLSIAGTRAGLAGERSGLFMEQIRIIKEMRKRDRLENGGRADSYTRPRYMVWENVPGAFSSAKGEDFRAVLEETARVVDENAVIPRPPKGKWTTSGAIVADGWSLAWRVLDAQFWGVPQRRRRITLVADFGGQSAPEILFEREGVSGSVEESGTERKDIAGAVERSVTTANRGVAYCLQGNCIDRSYTAGCNGKGWTEDVCYTLNTVDRPAVVDFGRIADRIYINADKSVTLQVQGGGGGAKTGLYCFTDKTVVRRLTPLECERLQGFPDGWTDIGGYTDTHGKTKLTADNARYKALGNSIAIPPWTWVLSRLNNYCISHTMASLFDGIGGFPLIWERLNGKGSCLWSSEIEDFPIAVTRRHFGDEDR